MVMQRDNGDGTGIWVDAAGNQISAYDAGGVTSVSPSLSTGAAWMQNSVYIAAGVGLLLGVGGMFAYSKRKK